MPARGTTRRAAEAAGPPGPRGSWAAGNLTAYEADRLGFLLGMRDRFGPVVRFGPRTAFVSDPAAVAVLLRSDHGFTIEENYLQRRLTPAEQREVRELRPALSPGLRPAALSAMPTILDRHLALALSGSAVRSAGGWFDPMPVLEQVISGAVVELYFGPGAEDLPDLLGELLDDLSLVIGNPFALPERWGTPTRRRIAARHDLLRGRVTHLLGVRRAAPPGEYDDLAAGVAARVATRCPVPRVADMLIGSLLASQRVPAAAVSWLLMMLAEHPDVQEQVAAETATPQPAGPHGSGFVDRAVLESLRLFPPTWLIVRTATRPVDVGGYRFAAGHHFMISPYVLHRDETAYPGCEAFRPERWAPGRPPDRQFLPFGAGMHVCPGRHLATQLMATVARQLTAHYAIERAPGPVVANPRTTLVPEGLRVALRPRERRTRPQLPALAAGLLL